MSGSIHTNEISREGALRPRVVRSVNPVADSSQGAANKSSLGGGFSSQLEGLLEASDLQVDAKTPAQSSTQDDSRDTSADSEAAADRDALDDAAAESEAREEAREEARAEAQAARDASQAAADKANARRDAENQAQDREPSQTELQLEPELIAAAPLHMKEASAANTDSQADELLTSPEQSQAPLMSDLSTDGEATDSQDAASTDLAADHGEESATNAEMLAEDAPEPDGADLESEEPASSTDVDTEADPLAAKANAHDDKFKGRDSAQNADASDLDAATNAEADALAQDDSTAVDAEVSADDAGAADRAEHLEAEAAEASSEASVEADAPDAANEGESLREERLERHDGEQEAQADNADADLNLESTTNDSLDALNGVDGADNLETSSRNDVLLGKAAKTDATMTQVAAASLVSGSTAGANSNAAPAATVTAGAAANIAGPSATASSDGQNSQSGHGNGQGNADANSSEAAQRNRGAKPARFSKAMQSRQIEVVRQISKSIGLRAATRADGRMNVLLAPEALGTISLEFSFDGEGGLRLEGTTANDATRHLLSGSVDELRQALRQENIELARFVLTGGRPGSDGNAAKNFQGDRHGSQAGRSGRGLVGAKGAADMTQDAGRDARSATGSVTLGEVDLQA